MTALLHHAQGHNPEQTSQHSWRSVAMQVADILKVKGHSTMTVRPAETVQAFAMRLKLERVGAMPVSEDGKTLVGIISERDVA
jgi:CBS domain-containing protein